MKLGFQHPLINQFWWFRWLSEITPSYEKGMWNGTLDTLYEFTLYQLPSGSRLRPKTLQAVDVPVIDNRLCERWHKSNGINVIIYDEMMCAGYRGGGKDSCQVRHHVPYFCLPSSSLYSNKKRDKLCSNLPSITVISFWKVTHHLSTSQHLSAFLNKFHRQNVRFQFYTTVYEQFLCVFLLCSDAEY